MKNEKKKKYIGVNSDTIMKTKISYNNETKHKFKRIIKRY